MDIQDTVEYGHEHVVYAFLAENVVGTLHTHGSRVFGQCDGTYHSPADSHEDCGGNTFARHIGNDEAQAVLVDAEEIIKIPSYIFGSVHIGIQVERFQLRKRRKCLGQDCLLDFLGDMQVVLDGFQLCVFPLCLLDESDLLGCLFNGSFEVFEIDWLGREVEGSLIHGTTNILHIAVGRYHNAF